MQCSAVLALLVAPDLSTTPYYSHCNNWNLEHSLAMHRDSRGRPQPRPASRVRVRFNAPCDATREQSKGFLRQERTRIHQTGVTFLAHVSGLQILLWRASCDEGCCNAISFVSFLAVCVCVCVSGGVSGGAIDEALGSRSCRRCLLYCTVVLPIHFWPRL